jgi:hypothetical protein
MQTEDLAEMNVGQVIWGWPHCVQDAALTQIAHTVGCFVISGSTSLRHQSDACVFGPTR